MLPQGNPDEQVSQAQILIVEDEVLIRALLAEELRGHGLTVIEAATADEAWIYLTSGGKADLIVSDVTMPGAMNGIELAARVRSSHPGLPFILTSGNPGTQNVAALGPFLPKPYRLDDAAALVMKNLDSAG
jgi:CheY-like chemotaxis protein